MEGSKRAGDKGHEAQTRDVDVNGDVAVACGGIRLMDKLHVLVAAAPTLLAADPLTGSLRPSPRPGVAR